MTRCPRAPSTPAVRSPRTRPRARFGPRAWRGPRALVAVLVVLAVAAGVAAVTTVTAPQFASGPATMVLWYDRPAAVFEEALPLGNGRIGAMVFGGPASDRIMLNESTLWTGGPDRSGREPGGGRVPAQGPPGPVQGRLPARRSAHPEAPGPVLAVVRAARRPVHRRPGARWRHPLRVSPRAGSRLGRGPYDVHGWPVVVRARGLRVSPGPVADHPAVGLRRHPSGVRPSLREPSQARCPVGRGAGPGHVGPRADRRRAKLPARRQGPGCLR